MNRRLRTRILEKLSQTPPATTTPTTSGNTALVAPAPALDVWAAYPEPMKSYDARQMQLINGLVYRLSNIANLLTKGKYNFQTLYNTSWQFDPSEFADPNTKYLMIFFMKVYKLLLNSGHAFSTKPINPQQLSALVNVLLQAPELNNISHSNIVGPVANQQTGNSDLAQTIRNTLRYLQPNVAGRQA